MIGLEKKGKTEKYEIRSKIMEKRFAAQFDIWPELTIWIHFGGALKFAFIYSYFNEHLEIFHEVLQMKTFSQAENGCSTDTPILEKRENYIKEVIDVVYGATKEIKDLFGCRRLSGKV